MSITEIKDKKTLINNFITSNYSDFEIQAKKCLSSQFKNKVDITKREFLHLDLLHDVIISLLDTSEEKTNKLYYLLQAGDLKIYVYGIIYRYASWEKSTFREQEKKYKVIESTIDQDPAAEEKDTEFKVLIDQEEQKAVNTIISLLEEDSVLEWHYIKLFKEYYFNDVTLQALSDKYSISINTIYSMITKTKNLIIYLLKENGLDKIAGRK